MEEKATNKQVGGDHYKKCKIQPIEYIHANGLGFIEGCIVKYISRWRDKGGLEDIRKIKHYCDLLIELEGEPTKMENGDMIFDGRVFVSPSKSLSFEIPADSNLSKIIKP